MAASESIDEAHRDAVLSSMPSSWGEPTTMLTDFLLAIALFWLAGRLFVRAARTGKTAVRWWACAFALGGLAALCGGTSHGFRNVLYPAVQVGLWYAAMLPVGLAGFCLLAGTAVACTEAPVRPLLMTFGLGKFIGFALWVAHQRDFLSVGVDAGLTGVLVLAVLTWGTIKKRFSGLGWIAAGLALGLGGAALRQTEWNPHRLFNHNDLFHLILIAACGLLYQGALRLPRGAHEATPRT